MSDTETHPAGGPSQADHIRANEEAALRETVENLDRKSILSRVFVTRPRFAIVIAIVMTLIGTMAIKTIPITQYPEVSPPEIVVSTTYPGANAVDLTRTVANVIEQEINGVEDMLYMNSSSSDSGSYSLTVTFAVGTDRDMDMVKVQNRLQRAMPKLPPEVTAQGVDVSLRSSDMLGFIALRSPNGTHGKLDLSNYAYANIRDTLLRVDGVGGVSIYGPKLSMRVWLDPERMAAQRMTAEEVIAAIRSQNVQAALGSVGAAPIIDLAVEQRYTVTAPGRLSTPEEFGQIVVRSAANGAMIRIRDIGRCEIGENNYGVEGLLDGKTSVSIALQQTPGTNAVEAMKNVKAEMDGLAARFPEDMEYLTVYDATAYITASIDEIVLTLLITFALVVIICYLFLQDARATLVPSLTIPVSLLSTFAVLKAADFTINTMTLFALVLAIGVVVDDAIVVVERVLHHMEKNKLDSKTATLVSMYEMTGAIIATTLVLLAIFVPVAFVSGITGRIYLQFAVTISMAVVFSTVNALTLSPALCATILRVPKPHRRGPFAWFNAGLDRLKRGYVHISKALARRIILAALLLAAATLGCLHVAKNLPASFLPAEDQGVVFINVELKEGLNRTSTDRLMRKITEEVTTYEGIGNVLSVSGVSFGGGNAENVGIVIVALKDWSQRTSPELHADAIVTRIQTFANTLHEARIFCMVPPSIPGLGMSGGVELQLQSIADNDPMKLESALNAFLTDLRMSPEVDPMRTYSSYTASTPRLLFDIDRLKTETFGVPVSTLFGTLQSYLGSYYVNDINLGNQVNQVILQSDWSSRSAPEDIANLYVKSAKGGMVPVGALADIRVELGPRNYSRYNLYPAAKIDITTRQGHTSGQTMERVRRLVKETLPREFKTEFSGLSYQEEQSSGQTGALVMAAFLFGYLFLVAQYESWTIPIPVMTSVSVAALGALLGLKLVNLPLSIYSQLGLILLVGLASKNAILIVEFAATRHADGLSIVDAAGEGAGERLRAVLMTALTFVLGVLPMVYATGAGANSRIEIGTTVYWGMIAATCAGIILIPGLYALFQTLREKGAALRKRLF